MKVYSLNGLLLWFLLFGELTFWLIAYKYELAMLVPSLKFPDKNAGQVGIRFEYRLVTWLGNN